MLQNRWILALVLVFFAVLAACQPEAASTSTPLPTDPPPPTEAATEEAEPTEEVEVTEAVEPTEEATLEMTEEATEVAMVPTEAATEEIEPTEEATEEVVEVTEEATEEPTEAATATTAPTRTPRPTVVPTDEPTEEATVEVTEEATEEPTEAATATTAPTRTPRPTVVPTEAPTEEVEVPELGTIVEVADDAGDFTILLQALEAADLTETLEGEGPFTVFAPNDEAFEAALEALDITAEELLENTELLTSTLLYHVAEGVVLAADLEDGAALPTLLEDQEITVSVDDDEVVLNDTVNVVAADVLASNGVIHIIDAVLLPPVEEAEVEPTATATATSRPTRTPRPTVTPGS